jgi:hypothetical protein
MLAVNKPLMEAKFSQMLAEESGMLYKAAKEAHYAASKYNYDTQIKEYNAGIDKSLPPMGDADSDTKKKWEDTAKEFAKAFVTALKNAGFDSTLADEIDNHVKSAQIDITVPALLPTIISPMGPCTGSLSISTATGAQIMIS